MEVFASGGRTRAVRVLVCILCALFIFAVVAAPPAQAVAVETVAVFGLAAVLSAATAALGYKLSNSTQGKATLSQMCNAFASDAAMGAKVLVGMKMYGLQEGMKYIKMQVKNGKTYLDSKVVAWCQQYLGKHGVYDDADLKPRDDVVSYLNSLGVNSYTTLSSSIPDDKLGISAPVMSYDNFKDYFELATLPISESEYNKTKCSVGRRNLGGKSAVSSNQYVFTCSSRGFTVRPEDIYVDGIKHSFIGESFSSKLSYISYNNGTTWSYESKYGSVLWSIDGSGYVYGLTNYLPMVGTAGNSTGLLGGISGTDTLGKDYVNLTLEQILAGLKDWAKDWYDAGVESVLDGAVEGDIDLPLTVGAGAATLNPDVAADEELVYTPSFDLPLEDVRSGDTAASDVTAGQENAKAQQETATVSENQSAVNSIVQYALDYINVDRGLFSKFPLCIPYDAYLLACAAGGRDAVSGSSVFGASPGDLSGAMTSAQVSEHSNFVPVVHIKNDLQLSDQKVPIDIEIDLTPFSDMVALGRAGVSIVFIAGLIAAEYARIKGGKS